MAPSLPRQIASMNQKLRNAFKSLKNEPMMHMVRLENPLRPLEKTNDDFDAATAIDFPRSAFRASRSVRR
jgi:hypothetical protein